MESPLLAHKLGMGVMDVVDHVHHLAVYMADEVGVILISGDGKEDPFLLLLGGCDLCELHHGGAVPVS